MQIQETELCFSKGVYLPKKNKTTIFWESSVFCKTMKKMKKQSEMKLAKNK